MKTMIFSKVLAISIRNRCLFEIQFVVWVKELDAKTE